MSGGIENQKRRVGRPSTGGAHPRFTFRAPPPLIRVIELEAARRGCKCSVVAREALDAYAATFPREIMQIAAEAA
jgi:hypothetical protein